jgi:hypothetical protein
MVDSCQFFPEAHHKRDNTHTPTRATYWLIIKERAMISQIDYIEKKLISRN